MIGWMPSRETRKPFHTPSRSETRIATTTASMTTPTLFGSVEPSMIVSATAPDTAMTAPTDKSMPRVAMTIVIPKDTNISGAL